MSKSNEVGRGEIWKWDKKNFPILVKDKLTIPNSICVNESTGSFYYSDTPKNKIYVDSLDYKELPNGVDSVFYDGSGSNGLPDGSAIDRFGFLWNARWDGSSIIRISPLGELIRTIKTPFSRPTSLVFGSSDQLFATSAQSANEIENGFTYQVSF
jgi:sugar lactone lactonase YvrE